MTPIKYLKYYSWNGSESSKSYDFGESVGCSETVGNESQNTKLSVFQLATLVSDQFSVCDWG